MDEWQLKSPPTNTTNTTTAVPEHHYGLPAPTADRPVSRQPIHASLRPMLDAEYVAFHDAYLQYEIPLEQRPWDTSIRSRPAWSRLGASEPSRVGLIRDVQLENCQVRVFV